MGKQENPERSAANYLPATLTIPSLRQAARSCQGCDLYQNATQTVFGEGPEDAILMFIGEVPGDWEDRLGRPFVGPAGKLFDRTLEEAGLRRSECYLTNVVKHFKWKAHGKRRLVVKPAARENRACLPWLEAEIRILQPQMIVCLGATAGQALLGAEFRVTKQRGQVLQTHWAPWLMATVHPSMLLRIPDPDERVKAYHEFIADLEIAAAHYLEIKQAAHH